MAGHASGVVLGRPAAADQGAAAGAHPVVGQGLQRMVDHGLGGDADRRTGDDVGQVVGGAWHLDQPDQRRETQERPLAPGATRPIARAAAKASAV